MTVKAYLTTSNGSSRKIREYLESNNIQYEAQITDHEPLSFEQLKEILMYTDNGIDDIISERSKAYSDLTAQGIDFNDLTLREFHQLVYQHPRLLKAPILVAKNTTIIGYNEENLGTLKSRKERKRELSFILDRLDRSYAPAV